MPSGVRGFLHFRRSYRHQCFCRSAQAPGPRAGRIVELRFWCPGLARLNAIARVPWGWSVPLGIVGGIVSGLFGVGGALIVPPALTAFFGVRQVEGQGLGLALVAPGSVIALVAYAGAGQVDWRLGIPLAVGGVVAISAGVAFAHSLPERRLRFAFCGLLVLIAALLALHG
jgi:hypothetical protein